MWETCWEGKNALDDMLPRLNYQLWAFPQSVWQPRSRFSRLKKLFCERHRDASHQEHTKHHWGSLKSLKSINLQDAAQRGLKNLFEQWRRLNLQLRQILFAVYRFSRSLLVRNWEIQCRNYFMKLVSVALLSIRVVIIGQFKLFTIFSFYSWNRRSSRSSLN